MLRGEFEEKEYWGDSYSDIDNYNCSYLFNSTNIIDINFKDWHLDALNSFENLAIDEETISLDKCLNTLNIDEDQDYLIKIPEIESQILQNLSFNIDEEIELSFNQNEFQKSWHLSSNLDNENLYEVFNHNFEDSTWSKYNDDLFHITNRQIYWTSKRLDSIINNEKHSDHSISEHNIEEDEIKPIFLYPTLLDKEQFPKKLISENKIKKRNEKLSNYMKLISYQKSEQNIRKLRINNLNNENVSKESNSFCTINDNIANKKKAFKWTEKRNKYFIASVETKKIAIELSKIIGVKSTAEKLNLRTKSINFWIKNGPIRKKGGGRKIKDPKMEEKVFKWYIEEKKNGGIITAGHIKEKAKEFSSYPNFLSSKGWLDKFKNRYNILYLDRDNKKIFKYKNPKNYI